MKQTTSSAVLESMGHSPSEESMVIGGYALAIAAALDSRGLDWHPVFKAAGVPFNLTNDPLDRLSGHQAGALIKASVLATGDPYFGLRVAEFVRASHFHVLGYGLLASDSLLDFSLRLQRNLALVSRSARLLVETLDGELVLRLRHLVYTRQEHEDLFWAFVLRFMRSLHRPDLKPLRVGFHRSCPKEGVHPYESCFGVTPEFDADHMYLVFSGADAHRPMNGACAELAHLHDRLAGQYLARLDRSDVCAQVRERINELLGSEECTRARIARELGMSEATLQMRLRTRNTSFLSLLESVRMENALGYVAQPGLSITEISYRTGFGDTSNFTRAFKRWTGHSPSAYRSSKLADRGATVP